MKFRDRVTIITGGARGIGKAIALTFAREGAKVVLVDLDKEGLTNLKIEIEKRKGEVITILCNISHLSRNGRDIDDLSVSLLLHRLDDCL